MADGRWLSLIHISQVEKHRELIRSSRARGNMKTAAIVGYTNAGKSTLLNTLTGSEEMCIRDRPYALASLCRRVGASEFAVTIVEAFVKLALFMGYMLSLIHI